MAATTTEEARRTVLKSLATVRKETSAAVADNQGLNEIANAMAKIVHNQPLEQETEQKQTVQQKGTSQQGLSATSRGSKGWRPWAKSKGKEKEEAVDQQQLQDQVQEQQQDAEQELQNRQKSEKTLQKEKDDHNAWICDNYDLYSILQATYHAKSAVDSENYALQSAIVDANLARTI